MLCCRRIGRPGGTPLGLSWLGQPADVVTEDRHSKRPTFDASLTQPAIGKGEQALRDRALVALHCFSGLRPEEFIRLRREDLATELTANGHYGLTAIVERGGRMVSLLLPEPAAAEVAALASSMGGTVESLSGPVLCARSVGGRPLSYRAARDVPDAACRGAGLPVVDAASLRAACAH